MNGPTCTGPGGDPGTTCGRKVYARGLCAGHWKQLNRGHQLAPLRAQRPRGDPLVMLTMRVTRTCRAAVRSAPDDARTTLESWAKKGKV